MKRFPAIIAIAVLSLGRACRRGHDEGTGLQATAEQQQAISGLRAAYAAFNRGDITAAVQLLDPQIEWTEPAEFPGGGTYHGQAGAKAYLTLSREAAAEVHSEPEKFIPVGDRIVVFVHARVRAHDSDVWQDVRLADVYTFRNGKAVQMRAFADRQEALRWVGM
jgi:uncharacterized protein